MKIYLQGAHYWMQTYHAVDWAPLHLLLPTLGLARSCESALLAQCCKGFSAPFAAASDIGPGLEAMEEYCSAVSTRDTVFYGFSLQLMEEQLLP